jgi:hypothetical protein
MNKKLDALLNTLEDVKNPKETVSVVHAAFDEKPHLVAFVEVVKEWSVSKKLEHAFKMTNSIDDAWWNNEGVTSMFPDKGCRSTSMGDMILVGETKYKCAALGWDKV